MFDLFAVPRPTTYTHTPYTYRQSMIFWSSSQLIHKLKRNCYYCKQKIVEIVHGIIAMLAFKTKLLYTLYTKSKTIFK